MRRNNRLFILLLYIFLAVYLLPMFPHGGSANELTRWATAVSLVERGTFEISATEDLIGKNVDTARVGEFTYSNKAPGAAVLAAPVYAVTRIFTGPPDASNIRVSWFAMRLVISTLPLFLLAVWLYRREADAFSLATLLFATPLFLYSLLFFSHVLVAVLIYFAFRLLYDREFTTKRNCFSAGFLSGLAVVSEFPAVAAVAAFGIGLLFTDKRERRDRVIFYALGGFPFLVFLLFYNNALFGSPFSFSYAYESFPEWAEVAGQGVFGIGLPTPANFFLLLLSPSRGLFFFAPVLIFSLITFFTSPERKTLRHKVKIAAVAVSIIMLCGHGAAHGGWAFGPRYLVFIIPLLLDSFFDGEADQFSGLWRGLLFTVSLVFCAVPALTFPFAPPEFTFPHNDFWTAFLIGENWFTPTLADVIGMRNGFWTVFPAAAGIFAALYLVWRDSFDPKPFAAGALIALIFAGIYFFAFDFDNAEAEFRRATIAERFFKPAGRLENYRRKAQADNNQNLLQRIDSFEWNIADTRANAPDGFPYTNEPPAAESPTRNFEKAARLQQSGEIDGAVKILETSKEKFPFIKCETATNLAVIYYTAGRREEALRELESVQQLVGPHSRPLCQRSQFLLGSLYSELDRKEDAAKAFQNFLNNTQNSADAEIQNYRRVLLSK